MGKGTTIDRWRAPKEFDQYRFNSERRGLTEGNPFSSHRTNLGDTKLSADLSSNPIVLSSGLLNLTSPTLTLPLQRTPLLQDRYSLIQLARVSLHGNDIATSLIGFLKTYTLPLAMTAGIVYLAISDDVPIRMGHLDRDMIEGLLFLFAQKNKKLTKGERRELKNREREESARKNGDDPHFEFKRYSPIRMWWMRITEKGIFFKDNEPCFPLGAISLMFDCLNESVKQTNDPASLGWLKLSIDLEEKDEYEALLKFSLLYLSAEQKLYKRMKELGPETAIEETKKHINDIYADFFPGIPSFPVESGFWSDLEKVYNLYRTGKIGSINLLEIILLCATEFAHKLKYGPDRVSFGPFEFTFDELFQLLLESIKNEIAVLQKKIRSPFKKERESAIGNYNLNLTAERFFDREDVPLDIRQKTALLYLMGGKAARNYIRDVFFAGTSDSSEIAGIAEIIGNYYQKYLEPRIKGTADLGRKILRPVRPQIGPPKEWNVLSLSDFKSSWKGSSLNPHASYTLFKKGLEYIRLTINRFKRNAETKIVLDVISDNITNTLIVFETLEEMLSSELNPDIFVMSLDLIINSVTSDLSNILKELREILSGDLKDGDSLYSQIRAVYAKYIPYAEPLLKQISAERSAENEPRAVAKRLLERMSNSQEPLKTIFSWELIKKNARADDIPLIVKLLSTAMSVVDTDEIGYRQKYRAWIDRLGMMDRTDASWQWLDRFKGLPDDHEMLAPAGLEEFFQDIAYPVGFDGVVHRDGYSTGFLRATAFLTPDQWIEFQSTIEEMRDELTRAAKTLEARHAGNDSKDKLREELRMIEDSSLRPALEDGVTRLLSGQFGVDTASFVRRLLKDSLSDTNKLYSLIVIGSLARKGNGCDIVVKRVLKNLIGLTLAGVTGNTLRLAIEMESSQNSRWRGAMAEFSSAMKYAENGAAVEALSSDIKTLERTPDFLVTFSNGWKTYIETKARVLTIDGESIMSGLLEAADQLSFRIRPRSSRIINLYLVGALGNEDMAVNLVKNTVSSHKKRFAHIQKINICFVNTLYRNWRVIKKLEVILN